MGTILRTAASHLQAPAGNSGADLWQAQKRVGVKSVNGYIYIWSGCGRVV